MQNKKKITIMPKGPYKVTGRVPLYQAIIKTDDEGTSRNWEKGKQYAEGEKDTYVLCRCGHSKNKPFCDGEHAATGFEGKERAGHKPYKDDCIVYEGEEINLFDNEKLCSSMRFCDCGRGVWDAVVNSKSKKDTKLAIDEAQACAAGRLTVETKDGTPLEKKLPEEIGLVEDTAAGLRGPLAVTGGIKLEGADGKTYEVRNRMTLCRCGQSKNMPFCDISHMRCEHMEGFDE